MVKPKNVIRCDVRSCGASIILGAAVVDADPLIDPEAVMRRHAHDQGWIFDGLKDYCFEHRHQAL